VAKRTKKTKSMVTITQRAAQELRAIQATNAKEEQHVLRIDTESEGFSLWLGPEQEEDTLVGSEDTVLLRATPELTKFLEETSVVIDCMDHPDGMRLIVYPEDEPPPEVSKPRKKTRPTARKTKTKK
jgi:Fe-S cluster assembly iron-binding protein IscA